MRDYIGVILAILLTFGVILGIGLVKVGNVSYYEIEVVEKVVKNSKSSSKYLIFAKIGETEKVFENADAWLRLKFNSSDIQAKLKVGGKYKVKTCGYRFQLFSWYENILEVE
jgi:hypothetical protein